MSRVWVWARWIGAAAILGLLAARLGAGPFLAGLRALDGWSLAAAAGIAVLTTMCCAWRWTLVARGLGIRVPWGGAVLAYYRSQFLNTTLPGGVLGDVHRAVHHGREISDVGRAARAVAWERSAGQLVQTVIAVAVLLMVPSPARAAMPAIAAVVAAVLVGILVLGRLVPHRGPSRWARALRTAAADLRAGLLARRAWPGVVLASAVVVVGHAATFLIAARAAGATGPTAELLPLALLVLLAMGVPATIGGWGPREGVAAWAFGAAGLGADLGVSTAVVYGVMVMVAYLPGALILVLEGWRRGRRRPAVVDPVRFGVPRVQSVPVAVGLEGAVHG